MTLEITPHALIVEAHASEHPPRFWLQNASVLNALELINWKCIYNGVDEMWFTQDDLFRCTGAGYSYWQAIDQWWLLAKTEIYNRLEHKEEYSELEYAQAKEFKERLGL